MADYDGQHRGDRGAYERYLAGMDASMRQKVALTAAHLLCRGTVADMGMGSGAGSHALAALYPGLDVIGVDVSETMVAMASEKYRLPNLRFRVGDIAAACLPPASLDGIFDSSVLHHVTSFNGYDHDAAARALAVQVGELRDDGVLVVRDFLAPEPGQVLLDLPAGEPADASDATACSPAALFERFAREFRKLAPEGERGFRFERVDASDAPALRPGFRRYRLDHRLAVEFALRKDYRADWDSEVLEEYTYFTQRQFEDLFARLGLRLLASTPLRNPWILRHRFEGQIDLWTDAGQRLEPPCTNYVIAGAKVPPGEGVRFREAGAAPPLGFLTLEHHRHRGTGEVMDLVRRPHLTVDIVPWFRAQGDVFVLARQSYPRPILRCRGPGEAPIDGSSPVEYVTEPLNALQTDRPLGSTVEEALADQAGLPAGALLGFRPGGHHYPSPGGIQEEVRSVLVEIEPLFVRRELPHRSGWSTSGRVRAMEARQILRAAQVGGLPDARLEMNVYELLLGLGMDPGPWLGDEVRLAGVVAADIHPRPFGEILDRPPRRLFEPASAPASRGFLDLRCVVFEELDSGGTPLHRRPLELVAPRPLGPDTVSVALLARHGGEVLIGLDDHDLPAAQAFAGNSELLVAPAWRLPRPVRTLGSAREWVAGRLEAEMGMGGVAFAELGGRYHPSPGLTPEAVYPHAAVVGAVSGRGRPLRWAPLREVASGRAALRDGHLRIAALRAAHALGLLTR